MLTINKGDVVVHYKRYRSLPKELSRTPDLYLYRIAGLVPNATTGETMVLYTSLYDERVWTRTVADFLSFVPEAGRYRFEKWDGAVAEPYTKDGLEEKK